MSVIPFVNLNMGHAVSNEQSVEYISSNPLFIHNDVELANIATAGDGSAEKPYIIENLSITVSGSILIGIYGTRAHFKIQNSYLDNVNHIIEAINLRNVENGVIKNNIITGTTHGIFLQNSSYISVENNSITSASESGVRLNNSFFSNISENYINTIRYNGIYLEHSNYNRIESNFVSEVANESIGEVGIGLKTNSDYNVIFNNTVSETDSAILVSASSYNNITNNVLKNNGIGISASPTGYEYETYSPVKFNRFTNNTIFNSESYGLNLCEGVTNSTISFNMFLANSIGSSSQAFDNGSSNYFDYNFWDEWTGPDTATPPESPDHIVDDIYLIDGSIINHDNHPLTNYVSTVNFDFLSRPRIYSPAVNEKISGSYSVSWGPALDTQGYSVTYTLYYSNDTGSTWILIDYNILYSTYEWDTHSLPNGTQYLLKVEANTSLGLETFDVLDGFISINNSGHWLSKPKLTYPVSGIVSGVLTVEWDGAVDTWAHTLDYSLYYSNNSASVWYLIADSIQATQFDWDTTTVPDGGTYGLKVTAFCSGGLNSSDYSKAPFTIRNTPHTLSQLTLQYPNGGEVITGSAIINWSTVIDSWGHEVTYSLEYSNDSGTNWYPIISNLLENEYTWQTYSLLGGSNYLIKVTATCQDDLKIDDISNGFFSIVEIKHTLSELKVTSPNGGETLSGNITIEWLEVKDSWNHDLSYSIYYSSDGGSTWVQIQNTTSTSHSWNTKSVNDGSNYLIKVAVSCSGGLSASDVSDQPFTIENFPNQTSTSSTSSSSSTEPTETSTSGTGGSFDNVIIIVIVTGSLVVVGSGASLIGYRRRKTKK